MGHLGFRACLPATFLSFLSQEESVLKSSLGQLSPEYRGALLSLVFLNQGSVS